MQPTDRIGGKMRARIESWDRRTAIVAVAALLLAAVACTERKPTVVGIGSGSTAGSYSATATAIARVVNQKNPDSGMRLSDVPTSGSVANIDGVLSGDVTFGLAQADVEFDAVDGTGPWAERGPQRELRSVFTLYTEAVTIVATRDSGIVSAADLIGRRVDIGHAESGANSNAVHVLDAIRADWREQSQISEAKPDERSAMYLRGDLDAFFTTVGHPTSDILFAVNSMPRARLVPVEHADEVARRQPFYNRVTISPELYPGIENETDVETVGVKTVFVTSASAPDDLVYEVTKTVFENVGELGRFDPVLRGLGPKQMVRGMVAPVHPGALRYFTEQGLIRDGPS